MEHKLLLWWPAAYLLLALGLWHRLTKKSKKNKEEKEGTPKHNGNQHSS